MYHNYLYIKPVYISTCQGDDYKIQTLVDIFVDLIY